MQEECNRNTLVIRVIPKGKPRLTRRDVWKKRPVVVRYYEYKDLIKKHITDIDIKDKLFVICFFKSKKKKYTTDYAHDKKPDADNILKGIMDIFVEQDQKIALVGCVKLFSDKDELLITTDVNIFLKYGSII